MARDEDKVHKPSRRAVLKAIAATSVVVALPKISTAQAAAKMAKSAAKYQDKPKNGQDCAACRFFIAPSGGKKTGTCQLVEGDISPKGWCQLFVKK